MKKTANFNGTNTYGTPSLALKLGHSLKKCANILKSYAIQHTDCILKSSANDFLELYSSDWAQEISSNALETLHKQKFNAPKRIPLAEDIKTLNTFLKSKTKSAVEDLEKKPSPTTWRNLSELTLAQVVLFNRRRGGEAQRIEIAGYTQGLAHGKTTQSEVLESLDKFELTQKIFTCLQDLVKKSQPYAVQ